jgi:Zn-dependent protease with chaperone function
VRLDTANRSLLGLVGVSLVSAVWLLCGVAGCILLSLIAYRVTRDGPGALVGDDALLPAAIFLALVGAGATLGARSLARQIASSRRLARRVSDLRMPTPSALEDAAERTGLAGRLVLVDCEEPFSFAYGALTPRVVVSRGLCEHTTPHELDAVLEHERYHVHNLDPLKVLLARSLPATFFYLPVLRDLHIRYMAGRELAADRRAVAAHGTRPLAAALFKVVRGPGWPELSTAAAIGGPELLDVRVSQLETGTEPALTRVTAARALLSLLGLAALAASFAASVVLAGGPTAITDQTGMGLRPADVLMGLACALPLAGGGWALYRWLSRRTHRPADPGRAARADPRMPRDGVRYR